MTPFVDLKKMQREAGDYARLLCAYMWYIFHCYCITGHTLKSLGALMYLKPKTLNNIYLSSWLPKFKCLGDVLDSVSLP